MSDKENYNLLKEEARELGAHLFGVADIRGIKDEINLPPDILRTLDRAVCLGVALSRGILDEIQNHPTKLYFHHYRSINVMLDQIALRLTAFIHAAGFSALPVPASQILDWSKQNAHLSHKKIGYLAGLGWIGRNNLLVNERWGSQFRLVSILTDMPLETDSPLKRDCGKCFACIKVCPQGAIKERREDFNHMSCFEKLKEFQKKGFVNQYICGICVKVCRGKRDLQKYPSV